MSPRHLLASLAAAAVLGAAVPASAAITLSGTVTSDNAFYLYLSSDNTTLGALVAGEALPGNWKTPVTFNVAIPHGGTWYLQVIGANQGAVNGGNPAAILGQFALSTGGTFSNSTQSLFTNTTDWLSAPTSGATAWTTPTVTPVQLGVNSPVNIWTQNNGGQPIPGISTSASWIWTQPTSAQFAAFSTTISAVPEPSTWAMMIIGFAAAGYVAYRRARKPAAAAA